MHGVEWREHHSWLYKNPNHKKLQTFALHVWQTLWIVCGVREVRWLELMNGMFLERKCALFHFLGLQFTIVYFLDAQFPQDADQLTVNAAGIDSLLLFRSIQMDSQCTKIDQDTKC